MVIFIIFSCIICICVTVFCIMTMTSLNQNQQENLVILEELRQKTTKELAEGHGILPTWILNNHCRQEFLKEIHNCFQKNNFDPQMTNLILDGDYKYLSFFIAGSAQKKGFSWGIQCAATFDFFNHYTPLPSADLDAFLKSQLNFYLINVEPEVLINNNKKLISDLLNTESVKLPFWTELVDQKKTFQNEVFKELEFLYPEEILFFRNHKIGNAIYYIAGALDMSGLNYPLQVLGTTMILKEQFLKKNYEYIYSLSKKLENLS